jgi:hypothetical protein
MHTADGERARRDIDALTDRQRTRIKDIATGSNYVLRSLQQPLQLRRTGAYRHPAKRASHNGRADIPG